MIHSLEVLERQRADILKQIGELGDMRRGSLVEHYLPCGKASCRCKKPGHRGHGPYISFTRKVRGKTQTRQLRAGYCLDKIRGEVETFHRFRELSDRLIAINEAICELRPVPGTGTEVKKTLRYPSRKKSSKRSSTS
jgi:hypothetical protein